jgi:hypothetical protein
MILSVVTQAERYGLAHKIEIVVSDNASTDNTEAVIKEIQAETQVPVRYHRNDDNLGAITNIIKTLELSRGHYWMLYGDDDAMVDGALPLILDAFREHPGTVTFLFEQQGGITKLSDSGAPATLTVSEAARQHFYYIGNAGVFAIKVDDAQAQLARWGFERFQTCWPQTQLAFAAMSASKLPRPVVAVPIESSTSPHHGGNTVYTSWYIWETTFYSLYRAALDLRSLAGTAFFAAACSHIFSLKRVLRTARDVALYATFFDLPQDIAQAREGTRNSLVHARGRALLPLILMWLVVVTPRALKVPALYSLIILGNPTRAANSVRQLRQSARTHKARRLEALKPGGERPRVYTSQDLGGA